jgi:hypothetical protein
MTTPAIYKDAFGVSAFTKEQALVMNGSAPCVSWHFRIKELEDWLTTLEEIIPQQTVHRLMLERLYFSLKAAHTKHKREHEEIITEAPTADDLIDYLASYAAAISTSIGEENFHV